jgi:signal peptidase II
MLKPSFRHLLAWLALAVIVIVLDQATKTLVLQHFKLGDSQTVTSYFNLVRVHNSGAAFSFLAGASGWQRWFFVGLGLVAAAFIVWMLRQHGGQRLFAFALAMILGGALGNVIDRLLHGYVGHDPGRRTRQRDRPAAARLRGRLPAVPLGLPGTGVPRRLLPVVQRGRQRHHAGRHLPDPGRTAARAPQPKLT